jgi:hypothetical protein
MNKNLTAFAKDNSVRVSLLKLNNLIRLRVNQKVDNAVNLIRLLSFKRLTLTLLSFAKAVKFLFIIILFLFQLFFLMKNVL